MKSESDLIVKVVVIGDAAVGKSSMLLRYVDDTFDDNYICTIGVDFKIKSLLVGECQIKLHLWDTAGQERFKSITHGYFYGSLGAIVVFDLTNQGSFENLERWIGEYREHVNIAKGVVVLAGNKTDQIQARQVPARDIEEFAEKMGCKYFEVSAYTGEGLKKLFEGVAGLIVQGLNASAVRPPEAKPTLGLSKRVEPKKKKCCGS